MPDNSSSMCYTMDVEVRRQESWQIVRFIQYGSTERIAKHHVKRRAVAAGFRQVGAIRVLRRH